LELLTELRVRINHFLEVTELGVHRELNDN
jgi:hypothetical protein